MALVVADRVQETSTTSGTGTLSLAGAVAGYRSFVASIGTGNTTYYTIFDPIANVWEVGVGTVTAGSPDTLSRNTVLSNSSGTTALISFTGNTISVWCDYPAETAVYQDTLGTAYAPEFAASNGFFVSTQTLVTNYTVASGYNAMTPGPFTVPAGLTVTVASGSVWTVV